MKDLIISEILDGNGDIQSLGYAIRYLLEKANGNGITIYIFLIGKQALEKFIGMKRLTKLIGEQALEKFNKEQGLEKSIEKPAKEKPGPSAENDEKETIEGELKNELEKRYLTEAEKDNENIVLLPKHLDDWSEISKKFPYNCQFRYIIATNIHRRIPLRYEGSIQGLPSGINYKNFYSFLKILEIKVLNSPPEDILFITDLNRNLTNKIFAAVVEATYPFTQITRNDNGPIQYCESYQYESLKFTIFVPHINTLSHSNEFSPSAALSPAIPERERLRFYNFKTSNQPFKEKIIIKAYIPEIKERNGKIIDPTNFTQKLFQDAIKSEEVRKALYILGFNKETTILMHGTTDMPNRVDTEDKDGLTGYDFSEVKDQKSDEFLRAIYRSDLFICSGAHSAQETLSLNGNKDKKLGLIVYCASHHMFELARQMNALLPPFIAQYLKPIKKYPGEKENPDEKENPGEKENYEKDTISALSNIIILAAYNKLFRYNKLKLDDNKDDNKDDKKISDVAKLFPDFPNNKDHIHFLCSEYQRRLHSVSEKVRESLFSSLY